MLFVQRIIFILQAPSCEVSWFNVRKVHGCASGCLHQGLLQKVNNLNMTMVRNTYFNTYYTKIYVRLIRTYLTNLITLMSFI